MTRYLRLFLFLSLWGNIHQANADETDLKELEKLLFKVADWQISHTEHLEKYRPLNWHFATFYIGLSELYQVTGNRKYFDHLFGIGRQHNWTTENDIYDADRMAVGQVYIDLNREKKDEKIIERLTWVLDAHLARKPQPDVRFTDNPYCREWWSWCDALFMAPPTFAKMYRLTGDIRYLDYAIDKWLITTGYLWDKDENLIYRDDRFFGRLTGSGRKVFWSRGNGWVFAALCMMLDIIPPSHPKYPLFLNQFKQMAGKLVSIRSADGLWRPSLLDEKMYPQPETSGSSFFCYGILWGIEKGILPEKDYMETAMKAWEGLKLQVNEEGRVGHVQPPGIEPKPFSADEWHEYGTGAFLMAGCKLYEMLNPE